MTNKKIDKTKENKDRANVQIGLFRKTSITSLEAVDDSILQIWLQKQLPITRKKKK